MMTSTTTTTDETLAMIQFIQHVKQENKIF